MEDKSKKRAKVSKENGKKGGRPKKTDITENTEFENELSDKSAPIQTEGDSKKEQDRRTVKPSDCEKARQTMKSENGRTNNIITKK